MLAKFAAWCYNYANTKARRRVMACFAHNAGYFFSYYYFFTVKE